MNDNVNINDQAVDGNRPEDGLHDRFARLIATQCQRSIRVLGESTESRPVTLQDFKSTLEKSVSALNVCIIMNFII